MATQSVNKDLQGPDWPLGCIQVPTPGTPVQITSLIDPGNNTWAPGVAAPANNGTPEPMYTIRCQQILFQAMIPASNNNGTQLNTGNVYLVRKGAGASNRSDYGAIVKTLVPGETFFLGSAATVTDVFSPYRYFLDADNANDGCQVTCFIF